LSLADVWARIKKLKSAEEAIVVATGAPRETGCPPWVVLGVKADKTYRGVKHRGGCYESARSNVGGRRGGDQLASQNVRQRPAMTSRR
jgi:hypothetical protein